MRRSRRLLVLMLVALLSRLDTTASAQGARGLPDPLSSSALTDLLIGAGLDEADLELVAVPLDRYHAAFRDLRSGPIEDWLDRRRDDGGGLFGGGSDPDAVEDRVDDQRSLADRIASLDDRLFADLRAAGVTESVAEQARMARSRDRSRTLAGGRYTRGLRFEPTAVYAEVCEKVDRSPQWALDAAVRQILVAHDRERTTRLASLARAAMQVAVERAELLAAADGAAPDPESAGPEDFERWFAARREAERTAAEDVRDLQASLIAADRQTLERILASTGDDTEFSIAFRDAWLSEAHGSLFPDRESPASLFEAAREMHAAGELDDETFELVESVESSWRSQHRAVEDRMLRALERAVKDGARRGMSLGGMIEIELAGDDSAPEPTDLDEARQSRADLDRETRERLGEIAPTALASRVKEGAVPTFSFGGGEGEGGQIAFGVSLVGGEGLGDGEPIAIEIGDMLGDLDFGDGAVFVSSSVGGPIGGPGGGGLARPLDRETFGRICDRLAIDEATRPIADALFNDYRDGWAEIDATLVAEWNDVPKGGFGPQGPISVGDDDIARAASLRLSILDAVLTLDRGLFDDLALLAADAASAERAQAARHRSVCIDAAQGQGFGMPGGDRTATLDVVSIAEEALDPEDLTGILGLLDEWSRTQTPALEDRARTHIEVDRENAITQQEMERSFAEVEDGVFAPDPAIFERMQAIQSRRAAADRAIAIVNTDWTTRIAATLAADDQATADGFQLAVDRTAWPQCFRDPRTPQGNFDRALGLDDLDDGTRMAIETLRGEWLASWTAACRRLVDLERDGPRLEPFAMDPTEFDPRAMQKAQADKRRIRFERNEIDEKAIRELKSLLSADQQKIVGELPEEKKRMLLPGMGNVEMIIGG